MRGAPHSLGHQTQPTHTDSFPLTQEPLGRKAYCIPCWYKTSILYNAPQGLSNLHFFHIYYSQSKFKVLTRLDKYRVQVLGKNVCTCVLKGFTILCSSVS